MLLVIDIGNSNVVGCVCKIEKIDNCTEWIDVMRVKTDTNKSYSDCLVDFNYSMNDYFDKVKVIILSSVVPGLTNIYLNLCKDLFGIEPFLINYKAFLSMPINVPQPHIIGSDIVANAFYGFNRAPEGCVIVDFGTVLTFTTVYDAKIAGVTFVPGVKTAIDVLYDRTAQLPKVKIEAPTSVIGLDTCKAINAGVFYGYGGLVDRIVKVIEKEVNRPMKLFATGGLGSLLLPFVEAPFEYNIHLTVTGMKEIYECVNLR